MRARIVVSIMLSLTVAGCIIAAPPPGPPTAQFVAVAQPRLVFIPEAGISYAPDVVNVDLFFYGGIWYRRAGGAWYAGSAHTGPWRTIAEPPESFYRIPPGHAKYHIVKAREARPPAPEREQHPGRKTR